MEIPGLRYPGVDSSESEGRLSFRSWVWGVLAGGGLLVACNESRPPVTDAAEVAAPSGTVFGEHRQTLAAAATREVGEDCAAQGASACRSGLCLHTQPDPGLGLICSRQCQAEENCPVDWQCVSVHPNAGASFCVPPKGWSARPVQER